VAGAEGRLRTAPETLGSGFVSGQANALLAGLSSNPEGRRSNLKAMLGNAFGIRRVDAPCPEPPTRATRFDDLPRPKAPATCFMRRCASAGAAWKKPAFLSLG
jgi:hypothetical protein